MLNTRLCGLGSHAWCCTFHGTPAPLGAWGAAVPLLAPNEAVSIAAVGAAAGLALGRRTTCIARHNYSNLALHVSSPQ